MQGYFYATFSGKKSDIEKLLLFLDQKSQSGDHTGMYKAICFEYVHLPKEYEELANEEATEIIIGMRRVNAVDISWFAEYEFFNGTAAAVPDLEMLGGCCYIDAGGITRHESRKGSASSKTHLSFSPDRIEVEIQISCQLGLDIIEDDLETILTRLIVSDQNSIIRKLQMAFNSDGSIVIYHEGIPSTKTEEDYLTFTEDMKVFCSEIARTHPELEIKGQFAVEETWSCSGRGIYIYVTSEPGSQACHAKELSAESEPGIIFEDSPNEPIDNFGIGMEFIFDDDDDILDLD